MITFCWSYRQLAEALWLSLYCIRCKRQIITLQLSLCDSNSCKSNSWWDDHVTTHWYRSRWWRSWCHAGDDRDHEGTLEMEIKGARWSWPYHVTYFDCMWCLSFMHLILLSTTVALWDDPLLKFQGISVLPEYALLRQFVVLRHHMMIRCDKLYVHIQRVQASFAHAEYSG